LTGDILGSQRCDCGAQLSQAMEAIVKNGSGALLYLRQEGRGIELINKLKAYQLQDQGRDTVEANIELGFRPDERDFSVAAKILNLLELKNISLLTNNPRKLGTLKSFGFNVVDRIPLVCRANKYNQKYLEVKREKLGHYLGDINCQP
jgi:3,4-dihydroxy 2-butanone 4-phosphate synthase/GTP cyclohydrolase II